MEFRNCGTARTEFFERVRGSLSGRDRTGDYLGADFHAYRSNMNPSAPKTNSARPPTSSRMLKKS
jgi:hypothetical protein